MYRPEPSPTQERTRFLERARRVLGSRMRFHWNAELGRWQLQERGKRSHLWQHVWTVAGPVGEFREIGDWCLRQVRAMDARALDLAPVDAWKEMRKRADGTRRAYLAAAERRREAKQREVADKLGWGIKKGLILARRRILVPGSGGTREA